MQFTLPFLFLLIGCQTAPQEPLEKKETYRQCVSRHESIRKQRYFDLPDKFRETFAGYHHVLKYYSSTPSIAQMKKDVSKIEKENDIFDYTKNPDNKEFEARLLDTTPGRNRALFSFERHRNYLYGQNKDVTLLRVDYSKPEITYSCPLENFKDNGTSLICNLTGTITSSKQLEGSMLTFKYDLKMRLVPISEKYFYFEWLSSGDRLDQDQPEDHYFLRALFYTGSNDRFFKVENPYLDPAGDLNPEECAVLEGT